jgi:epoxyqueuosine reductase
LEVLKLSQQMQSSGALVRAVPVERLDDLRRDIEELNDDGKLDRAFYQENLTSFRFEPPAELPDTRSIVVAAWPQPALMVIAHDDNGSTPLVIPPTYADAARVDEEVLKSLEKALFPESYRFVKAQLPLKTLAARSGLIKYGRNNIAYVPKWGSYHRLTAFFSDMPCPDDPWQDREILAGCDGCLACLRTCPTGAIAEDRFLLRSERCLTYLNEKDTSAPFPEFVAPEAHNALVGCMRCQKICPYDKRVADWTVLRGELSAQETALLLEGRKDGEDVQALEGRLKSMGLDLAIFPRNLEVLLRRN